MTTIKSIEEKAKRYDEAIEQLRTMMPNWENLSYNGKTFLQGLVHIIPELKESEDELKWLTQFIQEEAYSLSLDIRDNEDRIKLKNLQRSLAWLEKQGEQKPAELDDTNAKRMFIKALERVEEQNNKGYKLTDCDKNSWWEDFKTYTSCTIAHNNAWSEEDEENFKGVMDALNFCNHESVAPYDIDPLYLASWFKSLKGRVQPHPKREWSEEDEKEVAVLEAYIRSRDWSERHIDRALSIVDELVKKLKSLRPQSQWKPSDEQMDTLEYYMHTLICNEHKEVLFGLYADLKKLMEE